MSPSDSSFTKVGRYGLTFKSFYMWSRIVDRGTPSSDDRFQVRCLSPTPRPAFNTSKSRRSFFPIQLGRSSWWSLIKPFQERSHHLGHDLSHVLSLMHPHACHQVLLDRVTACVSYTENTTKLCGCGKSCMHYLGHCCHTAISYSTACCAVMCKIN